MKKYFFFLLFLAIFAMSCQKDIEQSSITLAKTKEVTPTDAEQTPLFDQTKPQENDDVFKKIDAFKAKLAQIEAGTLPESDNGTAVNDAIWNIEAYVNSRYAQANKPFEKLVSATNTVRVSLNDDGTINNAALLTAVNQTKQNLNNQYQALIEVDKHVIAIDIRKKEPQVESGGSILLEVEGVYGLRRPISPTFGASDYWHWGLNLGKCDGPPTQQPLDAADKLQEKLNYRAIIPSVFFTDEEFKQFFGGTIHNPNDATLEDNIRDYLIFEQTPDLPNYNFYTCLEPSDMNFYLNGARTVVNALQPAGKSFIDIFMNDTQTTHLPVPHLLHYGVIHYGVSHLQKPLEEPTACCIN